MKPALAALLALAPLVIVACKDDPPTAPEQSPTAVTAAPLADRGSDRDSDGSRGRSSRIVGVLSSNGVAAGTFTGRVKLRDFVVEDNRLIAVGEVDGVARLANGATARIDQRFRTPVRLPLTTAAGPNDGSWQVMQVQGGCSVVRVQIGEISVSVLGTALGLTLAPISLDVSLGTLIGSLLCGLLQLQLPAIA
jgi:hypothetical protein